MNSPEFLLNVRYRFEPNVLSASKSAMRRRLRNLRKGDLVSVNVVYSDAQGDWLGVEHFEMKVQKILRDKQLLCEVPSGDRLVNAFKAALPAGAQVQVSRDFVLALRHQTPLSAEGQLPICIAAPRMLPSAPRLQYQFEVNQGEVWLDWKKPLQPGALKSLKATDVVVVIATYKFPDGSSGGMERVFLHIWKVLDDHLLLVEVLETDRSYPEFLEALPTGSLVEIDRACVVEIASWKATFLIEG